MATSVTPINTASAQPKAVKKTYKYFNLDTFEEVKETVEVPFVPAGDFQNAVQRLENNEVKILSALNAYLQRAAFAEARANIATKGASKKIVFDVIRPLRGLSPYDVMPKAEQTAALLAFVKSTPMLMDSIKASSLKAAEAGEDEDGDDDE